MESTYFPQYAEGLAIISPQSCHVHQVVERLTLNEKVLYVASLFPKDDAFLLSDLIVKCWQLFPNNFGLEGYEKLYPNANKVISTLCIKTGPVARGWILRAGPKQYKLSPLADIVLSKLLDITDNTCRLTQEQANLVAYLSSCTATTKYEANRRDEIFRSDVHRFWKQQENKLDIDRKVANKMGLALNKIANSLEDEAEVGDGKLYRQVRMLCHVNEYLKDKFTKPLKRSELERAHT